MRLLDLNLLRFGHFTDYVLDFETESANLHVIFGSNEAGKSTTLRAVLGLLFGIPERTQDHYVHDMQDLRIGARLENRTGEQLQVVRRKGRKDTLQEPNGQPVSDAVLNRFLGGVNRELFETMFGLSHEALVQGGQDLLEGRGEVGESLFGAGLGVRDIHAMRTALQKEASEIFAPRAQNPPLNKALKAFDEARKQANQLALKPRAWQDLQEQRQEAQQQLEEREQQHRQNLAELHRLQRLQRVLPRMRAREELLVAKQALDEVKLVPESCTQERTQAQQSWRSADVQERKRLDEQARSEQERAALQVPETLLARETAIEDLQKQLGAYLKAARDVPGLEAQIIAAREETQGILRELGRDETPEEAESLRIDVATQKRIHRLGQEGTRLEGERSRARKDVVGIDKKRRELQERLEELPPERDASALSQALAEFRRRGDLEAQVRALQTESAGIREKANKQLAALLLWQGPLEQVAELPLPLAETVDRFRGEFETCAERREALWGLQKELETMDGRSQAADAAATAQESLAEIKTQVENYARLKLSALLLGREIERYREQNQGPIIRRAGEFFRQMTLERFAELSTGFAEGDKMMLLCVRDNGQRVPVEGLSEGTRDQLYLALRLASLEQQAARSEPTPLVVDGILINFDDSRARATLALLGELSEQTQVLFFTHHRQLLALAREAVPDGRLKEHDLDGVGLGAPPLSRATVIP